MGLLFKKIAIFVSAVLLCGTVGLVVPLIFDRDVGGALASALLAIVGLIVGGIAGAMVNKRNF
jgi:hypothetical protein